MLRSSGEKLTPALTTRQHCQPLGRRVELGLHRVLLGEVDDLPAAGVDDVGGTLGAPDQNRNAAMRLRVKVLDRPNGL